MTLETHLKEIQAAAQNLEEAEERLEVLTDKLVAIAKEYVQEGHKNVINPSFNVNECSSDYLSYVGITEGSRIAELRSSGWSQQGALPLEYEDHLYFDSRCGYDPRYCGGGVGIYVPISYIESRLS